MERIILLPKELEEKLDDLTRLKEKVNGDLFYRRQDKYCLVDGLFVTGVGSLRNVQSFPERTRIAEEFFKRNPEYSFAKFCTHSMGSIALFGSRYAQHFSASDIAGIRQLLRIDKDYIAVLVTPQTKLICGLDNPRLRIVTDMPGFQRRNEECHQSLNEIARELGYDISELYARR